MNQCKRLSDCPVERLAQCRGEPVPPAGDVEVLRYGRFNEFVCVLPDDLDRLETHATRLTAERDGLIARLEESIVDCEANRHEREVVCANYEVLKAELTKARELLNTPHTDDWFEGVRLEAGHQIGRWGTDHDAGKAPADWFWLIGYLAQKAMTAHMAGNEEKARHHTISTGAAMLNWFRAIVGDSNAMRPGHEDGIDAAPVTTRIACNVDESCGQDAEAAKGGA